MKNKLLSEIAQLENYPTESQPVMLPINQVQREKNLRPILVNQTFISEAPNNYFNLEHPEWVGACIKNLDQHLHHLEISASWVMLSSQL